MANDLLRTRICIACNGQFSDEPCEPSECDIRRIIENFDPETLRPKGRWIESIVLQTDISTLYDYTCSECAIVCSRESNYCPNCGADMREVENENHT